MCRFVQEVLSLVVSKYWPCDQFCSNPTTSAQIFVQENISVQCSVSSLTSKNAVDWIWKPLMGCFVHAMHIPGNPDSKYWPCEPFLPYTRSAHIIPAGKVSVHCSVSCLTFKNAVDFIWKPLMGCFVHSMHIPGNPDSKHWPSNSLSIVLLTTYALWHTLQCIGCIV